MVSQLNVGRIPNVTQGPPGVILENKEKQPSYGQQLLLCSNMRMGWPVEWM